MSDDIIDFVCVRIQSELDKFEKTKTIPHDLLDGVWTVNDIEQCINTFDEKHKRLARKLIKIYAAKMGESLDTLRKSLRRDYTAIAFQSRSRSNEFAFPTILSRYRPSINPIRAIFYDCREIVRHYNPENERHVWLAELVTDLEFNNKILDALEHDIKRVERLIKRYYWPITTLDPTNIPLELFHARQLVKDGRHYYKFFKDIQSWKPDE